MITDAVRMKVDVSKKLITVDELAQILSVPKSWIYERTRQGTQAIPHIKLGNYVRFNADEVITFFRDKMA